jgi:iron complex outermembrane recepter protein
VNVLSQGELGEFVRFKGNIGFNWLFGPVSASAFLNYIGPFTPTDTSFVDRVGSYTTVNVSGGYELPWKGRIELGVNNLFDRDPPLDLQDGDSGQPFYNQFFHDPLGATWWMGYNQGF